jgi:ubiquinone/menaquinone biosynthesis C-methylase UbiE
MRDVDDQLRAHGFSLGRGFYSKDLASSPSTQADQVWSKLARENPIRAAAATPLQDPFAKYPDLVEAGIPNGPSLVLDAGCGYGRVAIPLMRKRTGIRLVGLDASPVMLSCFLDLVAREAPGVSIRERLTLVHSDVNQLLFDEGTFDYVFSCAVLLHNPYRDVETMISEFHRVLRPQGKLILVASFPGLYNLEGLQAWAYLKLIDEARANGPVRVYTKAGVHRLFHRWSRVTLMPTGATLIPRQIGKWGLPFGGAIRGVNAWVERRGRGLIGSTSFMAKSIDVIAVK